MTTRTCPPCDRLCSQGRACPYRHQYLSDAKPPRQPGDGMAVLLLVVGAAMLPVIVVGAIAVIVGWQP